MADKNSSGPVEIIGVAQGVRAGAKAINLDIGKAQNDQSNEEKNSAIPSTETAAKRGLGELDAAPSIKGDEAIRYLRFELFSLASRNHANYHDGDLMDCTAPHCLPAAVALRKTEGRHTTLK